MNLKKLAALTISTALALSFIATSAQAATPTPAPTSESRVVTGASAFFRVDLGWMVTWANPSSTVGITGYKVTSSPLGQTCSVSGANAKSCTFSASALSFTGNFTFTVQVVSGALIGPASAPSNSVYYYSIPSAPMDPMAKPISSSEIDVTWVPAAYTGGLPVYGYKITFWPMLPGGSPDSSRQNTYLATTNFAALTGLLVSQPYVINVATCNAYGCDSADYWAYAATNSATGAATKFSAPASINGGSASTTCWDTILNGGSPSSSSATVTKSSTSCLGVVANPATYPVVVPTATSMDAVYPVLATKLTNYASIMGLSASYSMSAWSKTGGFYWFAYVYALSKSVSQGFTTATTLTSSTPAVCTTDSQMVHFVSVGTCTITAAVAGSNIFTAATSAPYSFKVVA